MTQAATDRSRYTDRLLSIMLIGVGVIQSAPRNGVHVAIVRTPPA
ncbi:hypothetical protein [Sphingomonas arantia]